MDDLSGHMARARDQAYLRGAHEGKMFRLAAGSSYQRRQALDWLNTVIDIRGRPN